MKAARDHPVIKAAQSNAQIEPVHRYHTRMFL